VTTHLLDILFYLFVGFILLSGVAFWTLFIGWKTKMWVWDDEYADVIDVKEVGRGNW
jgi:hypothetical protein